MGALASRKIVKSSASGRKIYGHIQQISGTSDGQGGLVNGGTWTDVSGLSHVAVTYRTWSLYEQFIAQQSYPGVNSRVYIKYRASVNITSKMRLVIGSKIYWIRGVDNYDFGNESLLLFLEELQSTGSNH